MNSSSTNSKLSERVDNDFFIYIYESDFFFNKKLQLMTFIPVGGNIKCLGAGLISRVIRI